jgi:hypothetical protein
MNMDIILGLTWSNAGFYITVLVMSFIFLAVVQRQIGGKP